MRQEPASPTSPISFDRVLDDEYRYLYGATRSGDDEVDRRHEEAGHAALCLSGGGVRSASVGLGVLQGLAQAGVLGNFDYVSTVSGGGYIGGWLSAWRLRARDRREVSARWIGRSAPGSIASTGSCRPGILTRSCRGSTARRASSRFPSHSRRSRCSSGRSNCRLSPAAYWM